MKHEVRVIFGDTDMMGVVYYANYLRYFESARAALLRSLGFEPEKMREVSTGLPVIETYCRHRNPARYDDLLVVAIHVEKITGATIRFTYDIVRGADAIAEGYTVHACLDVQTGRPRRIPQPLRASLERAGLLQEKA